MATGSIQQVKRKANAGLINVMSANMCWLNAILQMLELSHMPLFLEGLILCLNMHASACLP